MTYTLQFTDRCIYPKSLAKRLRIKM